MPQTKSRTSLESNFDVILDKKYVHFGPYKGTLWNRVPIHYLKELVATQPEDSLAYGLAKKQLEKRAVSEEKQMDISRHAINRMSTRYIYDYISERKRLPSGDCEGIVDYTNRLAWDAIKNGVVIPNNEDGILIEYQNKKWKFIRLANKEPRLITIIPID